MPSAQEYADAVNKACDVAVSMEAETLMQFKVDAREVAKLAGRELSEIRMLRYRRRDDGEIEEYHVHGYLFHVKEGSE